MSGNNKNNSKAKNNKPSAKKSSGQSTKPVLKAEEVVIEAIEEVPAVEDAAVVEEAPVAEEVVVVAEEVHEVVEEVKIAEATIESTVEVAAEVKPEPAFAPVAYEPAWDVETWVALSNLKLGIAPYAMAAALHAQAPGTMLTEAQVKSLVTSVLGTTIN